VKISVVFVSASLLILVLSGCRAHVGQLSAKELADQQAEQRAELEDERTELEQIAPPAKSRYMAIHSFDSWENPYVTVQSNVVELHVTRGDANPTNLGIGGMLRPVAARRAELTLSMDKLGEGVSAVPADAWPYGRVVAIEEAHHVPANAEPAVRRNMEATVAKLNDLGIVVYDLNEGKLQ
jgi:hypothetical protein